MIPPSTAAALVLIALVPGYIYLRRTEDVRRPRDRSALDEFLEVLTVGIGTTGTALAIMLLAVPDWIPASLHGVSFDATPTNLRPAVISVGSVALLAMVLAVVASLIAGRRDAPSYAANVWAATFGQRTGKQLPYVSVELSDGRGRIEGVLHAYTTVHGDRPRDISVMKPRVTRDGVTWEAGVDFVVINDHEIAKIWLSLVEDPGQPA